MGAGLLITSAILLVFLLNVRCVARLGAPRTWRLDIDVSINVNGERVSHDVEPRLLLVHYLRETLGLTGTHWGCDTSNCGACVVLMDGRPVKSCTILAAMCVGHEIRTVESLERDGRLDAVQEGFHEKHALQCGFCTPGMLMTARALLDENPDPTDGEIRTAISGAICRCTGYKNIVAAVRWAADEEAAAKQETPTWQ
jgi:carbon-monoxide dehydrogenase small subunit